MIDPLSLAGIIGLGFTGVKTLANLIPTKAEVAQRKRIKQLTELENQGRLGLTDQQRADLTSLGLEPLQAKERELRARAGETIGLEEVGAGGSILQQQATQDSIRQATKDVGIAVQQADLQQAQIQKQELEALKQNELALQEQQKQDVLQGAEDIIVGGINVAAQTQRAKQEGLLMNSTKAQRDVIASALNNNTYRQADGTFNPLVIDALRRMNFSPSAISILESMPEDRFISLFQSGYFAQPQGYTYGGYNPPGMGFYGPVGGR